MPVVGIARRVIGGSIRAVTTATQQAVLEPLCQLGRVSRAVVQLPSLVLRVAAKQGKHSKGRMVAEPASMAQLADVLLDLHWAAAADAFVAMGIYKSTEIGRDRAIEGLWEHFADLVRKGDQRSIQEAVASKDHQQLEKLLLQLNARFNELAAERVAGLPSLSAPSQEMVVSMMDKLQQVIDQQAHEMAGLREDVLDIKAHQANLAEREQVIEAQRQQLAFKDQQLAAKDRQLVAKDRQLVAKDQQLFAKDQQLVAKDQLLAVREQQQVAKDEQLQQKDARIRELEVLLAQAQAHTQPEPVHVSERMGLEPLDVSFRQATHVAAIRAARPQHSPVQVRAAACTLPRAAGRPVAAATHVQHAGCRAAIC